MILLFSWSHLVLCVRVVRDPLEEDHEDEVHEEAQQEEQLGKELEQNLVIGAFQHLEKTGNLLRRLLLQNNLFPFQGHAKHFASTIYFCIFCGNKLYR